MDGAGEHHYAVRGKVGYPFFGELVRDCMERTERAMTQEHAFKAAELCLIAEQEARAPRVAGPGASCPGAQVRPGQVQIVAADALWLP